MTNKLTFAERTDSQYHRSPIILLETDGQHYFAEFETAEQLDFFVNTLGVRYEAITWRETERCGILREFRMSHRIEDAVRTYFWSLDELPEGAKPIKALSNGRVVTCYFHNNGETVTFYRPNPNAHGVYHPLALEDHIAHQRIYGSY